MKLKVYKLRRGILIALLAFGFVCGARAASNTNGGYTELDLVSDGFDTNAVQTDPNLVNAWGIVAGTKTIWVNDNETGLMTTYNPVGKPMKSFVNVPSSGGPTGGNPTGLVLNNTAGFVISNGAKSAPATFLIATEDGLIVAWNSLLGTNSMIVVNNSSSNTVPVPGGNDSTHAVYKGLAIVKDESGVPHLYAANFSGGVIDEFDGNFNYIKSFTDDNLPDSFAPFNVRNLRGRLFVTFARQSLPEAEDDQSGPGNGLLDIFDADGTMLRRVVPPGAQLNSPWGMVIAPPNFGKFSRALLVGNFGDGSINAFDVLTGKWLGHFTRPNGDQLFVSGLWGLTFEKEEVPGNECGFSAQRLYFTAGPNGESHGLLGVLRPVSPAFPPVQ
ncbi:MAG TPA: TIGR03118 family protein [Verrucomicrobiae bacterium]|nr:TIGR03118 family protein [Verrucomicrobiae bacterium]